MKNQKNKEPLPKNVCFLDGFTLRFGQAVGRAAGVWRVRVGREVWNVWEEDVFVSPAVARRVLRGMFD